MYIYSDSSELKTAIIATKKRGISIGFIPTMGALHQGHMALVHKALSENDIIVVSIFVNPTQFNTAEDLNKYPRTLEADLALLAETAPDCLVFTPTVDDIYGTEASATTYHFDGLEHEMEGKFRPGHFNGVGTILSRLFSIVSPTRAYFGEKDFQQLQIVKKLVAIERFPVTIVGCPIHRAENGLALSSRNKRLTSQQYQEAPLLYKTLLQAKEDFGTKSVTTISAWVSLQFQKNTELSLEYFYIASESDLKPTTTPIEKLKYRAFIAAFAGKVRLIDTIALN